MRANFRLAVRSPCASMSSVGTALKWGLTVGIKGRAKPRAILYEDRKLEPHKLLLISIASSAATRESAYGLSSRRRRRTDRIKLWLYSAIILECRRGGMKQTRDPSRSPYARKSSVLIAVSRYICAGGQKGTIHIVSRYLIAPAMEIFVETAATEYLLNASITRKMRNSTRNMR